jgi:hypothetical protein
MRTATTTTERPRPRRSVELKPEEMSGLKKMINRLGTKYDTALKLGITTVTLDNILLRGTGSESSIGKIREALSI